MDERLAIHGGPKAVTNKLQGWPHFDEKAIAAVEQVLRSGKVNYWTGKKGMEFEQRFAEWQGSNYAISVATGTAALHVALTVLGIGPGDEVIVPSYTFIATGFSVVQAGAVPRFADVNIEDHSISVDSAEKLVTKRTKAIMPVHLYGNVCDMDKISAFARHHKLFVVEDNAEAFGGEYKGRKTGTLGDIAGCPLECGAELLLRRHVAVATSRGVVLGARRCAGRRRRRCGMRCAMCGIGWSATSARRTCSRGLRPDGVPCRRGSPTCRADRRGGRPAARGSRPGPRAAHELHRARAKVGRVQVVRARHRDRLAPRPARCRA